MFHVEGERFVHRGSLTVVDATFTRTGGAQRAYLAIVPTDPLQGAQWTLELTTVELGTSLQRGVYRDAYQAPNPPLGSPGLKVIGSSLFGYCLESYRGEFEIHEYVGTTTVERLTATFRQRCRTADQPTTMVTGCIHVE